MLFWCRYSSIGETTAKIVSNGAGALTVTTGGAADLILNTNREQMQEQSLLQMAQMEI